MCVRASFEAKMCSFLYFDVTFHKILFITHYINK